MATPFIWEGGSGRGKPTVHHLLQGFVRRGYDVHVVTATNRPELRRQALDGVQVHYTRPPLTTRRFRFDAENSFLTLVRDEGRRARRHVEFRAWWLQFVVLGARLARRLADELEPTIAYGVNNPGVPVALAAGRRAGAVTVARVMGTEIGQVAGVDIDRDEGARPGLARTLALWAVRFDELAAFKLPCDAWVVTDDGQVGRRTLTEWLGVPPDRLWLWRNGVDKARYEAAPGRAAARRLLGVDPDELVVLWASQLTDWKHPERLLDALPGLARSVPRLRTLVVGDGPERAELERRAERLGVADRVRFEGFVAHDAMVQYYRASDAFVALYDRANVSNTLLEAMLAGLPVVALDNGRTREVVREGRTGLLVDPERLADLAPTLARILADDLLREALGRGAERWADDNLLSWDERIAREIDAIEDLAARSSATRR